MNVDLMQLQVWLDAKEDEHLEFKEAKCRYDFEKLVKYCVALANEGGGTIILGVTDRHPRRVIGSQAFQNLERTKAGLIERLRLRVNAVAIQHPEGRVIVFSVPSRPAGMPIQYGGAYWMRAGEDLAPMTSDLLNAVSHRDYRLAGSVFVRQLPRRLEVVSPGGFPPGINLDNILWRQAPRNRRIAEVFARCGLVERSGQGMNLMFEECIKESKPTPDFTGTDDYQVSVTLSGEIQDPQFLRFLEQIGRERLATFTTQDFLVLDLVRREQPIADQLKERLPRLIDEGVVETIGHGRGARYILSRRFYGFVGKKGVYTRKKGLDRETNKALLVKHIEDNQREGSQLAELLQVLPALSSHQVQRLLRDLKSEERIHIIGRTKGARWFPGPGPAVTHHSTDDLSV